ncbi:hypothetical protein [Vibrio agarivorans]|uniref:hypothetical protein n=1 Tax=Vibrio agarivorans TaxID=153622 RepID=UPI002230F4A7|nr:hypothetical protein [Vibrio agarivorans]MDN3660361.1 hypothetical protein [Vibrio agarivorans]
MYDVKSMKEDIERAVEVVNQQVKNKFVDAFQAIYVDGNVPNKFPNEVKIEKHIITSASALNEVLSGEGFYIIFTDAEIDGNNCLLTTVEGLKAIYRGECRTTKKRLQSHLFNRRYKEDYEHRKRNYLSKPENANKGFYEPFWAACLKVDENNGLNLDESNDNSQWMVIVHNMNGSSQKVRVLAELAFDEVFGKPIASRERT